MNEHKANDPGSTHVSSSAGDYARLRDLFTAAADVDEGDRPAWLIAHVPDRAARAALEQLLAADRTECGYLDISADEHAACMAAEAALQPDGLVGQRVGAFRLTRLLGQGGMAAVFLGEREEGDFRQCVAVKLLQRGLYSEIEQRLFRRERQLLAGLEHPNIARLIDGGVTGAGIPYLVIEYVDGEPITRHATDRRLDVRQRLQLFLIVCRAVEAAHRALIVHRDIKPSNILVAGDGTVKLLDFGIAKLLEEDSQSPTVGVFTPEYAAPEQLASAPVTTATDVYALGVLLHELLLGQRPQGNPTRRPSSLAGANGGGKAMVPKPASLQHALRGDIDTIVLKCLAVEADRRYTSAGALADDVQRHLDGKPVEAHPPSAWYRASKFIQRHRGSVLVTAALVLAMLAALGLALWQARVARSEANQAREIQAFVESLFQPLTEGTAPDKEPSLNDLLQRGIERIESSFHDNLSAQADLLDMFSRIEDQLGEIKSNRDLSERAYQVTERLYGPNDVRTLDTREKHGRILYRLGEYAAASAQLTAVRSAMQANNIHGTSMAALLEDLSFVRSAQGAQDDELIALNQKALTERLADRESTPENLATGYNNLALAYVHANQLERALDLFRKAHGLFAQAKGESYVTATSLANVGGVLFRLGRWREGLASQQASRAMLRRIGIDSHQMLSQVLMGICETAAQLELDSQAGPACDEAVAMIAHIQGESHPRFARALALRAAAEISAANFAAAQVDLDRAHAVVAANAGDPAPAFHAFDVIAARMDRLRGDYAQLRAHLGPAMAALGNARGPPTPVLPAWFALACERAPGAGCSGAEVERARQALADPKFAQHPDQLPARVALAQIDLLHGDANQAIDLIENGLAIAGPELGARHSWLGEAHLVLGDAHKLLGEDAGATKEYQAAATIVNTLPADHPLRASVSSRLAQPH